MMRIVRWTLGLGLLGACVGPPVGAVRDTGVNPGTDAVADAVVDGAIDVIDAPAGDVADAGARDADAAMLPDVDASETDVTMAQDIVDADRVDPTDRRDVADEGVAPVDAGPVVMRYEFVSHTATSAPGATITFRGVMHWHGVLRSPPDAGAGGIQFEGWFR